MNERIRQLADKIWEEKYWTNPNTDKLLPAQLNRFAELIVKECLAHGKLTQSQTVVNGSEEYNAGREMGIEVFMNQIKLHFGVEE